MGRLADFAPACYSTPTSGGANLVRLGGFRRPPYATMKFLYTQPQAAEWAGNIEPPDDEP